MWHVSFSLNLEVQIVPVNSINISRFDYADGSYLGLYRFCATHTWDDVFRLDSVDEAVAALTEVVLND